MKPIIILDPGHGMGNRRAGRYDPGAVVDGIHEAHIAMLYVDTLREMLRAKKIPVVRTRVDSQDPCHVSARARIARDYQGTLMLSFHCNAADGQASGTETFYRGIVNRAKAKAINSAVRSALGTRDRGAKTESQSQHGNLAIMNFQPCFLVELGFLDHAGDRKKILDRGNRLAVCESLISVIL